MITGFNNEFDVDEVRFHIQTEDRRTKRPRVQTLVYSSGHIVGTLKTPYKDLLDLKDVVDLDEIVTALMKQQHLLIMQEVKDGRYDPNYVNKLMQEWLSNKTLEEVIIDYKAWVKTKKENKG